MHEELDRVRVRIDAIDRSLAELLDERQLLALEVARVKDGPVYSPGREAAIVAGSHHVAVTEAILRSSRSAMVRARPAVTGAGGGVLGVPGSFAVIAGPCSIETQRQMDVTAAELRLMGLTRMRAGAWKPRTNRSAFQGLGVMGLDMMRTACTANKLELWTEIRDLENIEHIEKIDVAWVGARNGQNFELLRKVGKAAKRVVLKRGAGMTVDEWAGAADYLLDGGASVALCERGVRSFDRGFRNMLDVAGALAAKRMTGLEVLVDVSHSTGLPWLAAPLARAARAAGLDGCMVEAHPSPRESVTDAEQALSFGELRALVEGLA